MASLILRENFLFPLPNWRIAAAMVDQPGPGVFERLRPFLRQFLPALRGCPCEMVDLFIVTPDQQRRFAYQKVLQLNRAIHKPGLGVLTPRVKPYGVQPPVPTIVELARPRADEQEAFDELAPRRLRSVIYGVTSCRSFGMGGHVPGGFAGNGARDRVTNTCCAFFPSASDHEDQEQRGTDAPAGVFGHNSASLPRAMEAEPARALVCHAEQSASAIAQGRAVWIVAGAGHTEHSSPRTPRIPAHARKLALHTGATTKAVQEQLRHADPRVTLGMYSHVISEDRRNALERVAALLNLTADSSCAQLRPNAPKSERQEEWIQ